ncbi:MAG: hypothetical protein CL539_18620 [Alcanivorax sp.]|uniref:plasmid mobilization protein n=1 Tax=Alcanivorax sp. TaxID=1872427 RepID=UPI000C91C907|nr:hypothetical protein [Alcanivorax sp.]
MIEVSQILAFPLITIFPLLSCRKRHNPPRFLSDFHTHEAPPWTCLADYPEFVVVAEPKKIPLKGGQGKFFNVEMQYKTRNCIALMAKNERSKFLQIRVTPEDHERVRLAATAAGLTISDWCRKVMIDASTGSSFLAVRASELIRNAKLGDLISEASTYHRWMAIRDKLEKPNEEELGALITLFPDQKHWLLTGENE